jgi:hypothetical protein
MTPQIDDKTLGLLRFLLPDFNPIIEPAGAEGYSAHIGRLDLPPAHGADYYFRLWLYPYGDREICAELVEDSRDGTYFWSRLFELAEFRGSKERLISAFHEELEALITHETRIIQRKGWLAWHFRCEYRASGNWECLSGHSALRGGFKPPQIRGRRRVYGSAALIAKDSSN